MPTLRTPLKQSERWAARTVILSLVGLLFFSTDGLVFDLTPWAQAVITAATSWGYPSRAREESAVVLFSEEDVRQNALESERSFPIPYRLHGLALKSIAAAHPRAIFIDFAFVHDNTFADYYRIKMECAAESTASSECESRARDSIPDRKWVDLINVVCAIAKTTRVFVVDTAEVGVPDQRSETLGDCATPVGAFIDKEHISSGSLTYPRSGHAPKEAESIPELLARREFQEAFDQGRDLGKHDPEFETPVCGCKIGTRCEPLSAAYALWLSDHCDRPQALAGLPKTMAVIWPARARPGPPSEPCSVTDSWMLFVLRMIDRGPEALKHDCPDARTFAVDRFLHVSTDFDVDAQVYGRTVFYGAKLAMSGDVVRSPVFAELPAVYYHAVAYDNLVSFDGRPKHSPAWAPWFLSLLLVVGAAILARWPHPHLWKRRDATGWLKQYVVLVRLLFFAILVLASFIGWQASKRVQEPEYLLLVCFLLYVLYRGYTATLLLFIALTCFAISLVLYLKFDVSFDKFLSTILFFEVVHLMLTYLSIAAKKVDSLYDTEVGKKVSVSQFVTLLLLEPFRPHQEPA